MSLGDEPRRTLGERRGSRGKASNDHDDLASSRTPAIHQRTTATGIASGKPRQNATALYNALIAEAEAERQRLRWPMWYLDDRAGSPDGYFSKAKHPDTATGRQATWFSLQLIFDALFPGGFRIKVEPIDPTLTTALARPETKQTARLRASTHWRTSAHYRDLGRVGGRSTLAKHGPAHFRNAGRLSGLARAQRRKTDANGQGRER
jgi:hypothetical protein